MTQQEPRSEASGSRRGPEPHAARRTSIGAGCTDQRAQGGGRVAPPSSRSRERSAQRNVRQQFGSSLWLTLMASIRPVVSRGDLRGSAIGLLAASHLTGPSRQLEMDIERGELRRRPCGSGAMIPSMKRLLGISFARSYLAARRRQRRCRRHPGCQGRSCGSGGGAPWRTPIRSIWSCSGASGGATGK